MTSTGYCSPLDLPGRQPHVPLSCCFGTASLECTRIVPTPTRIRTRRDTTSAGWFSHLTRQEATMSFIPCFAERWGLQRELSVDSRHASLPDVNLGDSRFAGTP